MDDAIQLLRCLADVGYRLPYVRRSRFVFQQKSGGAFSIAHIEHNASSRFFIVPCGCIQSGVQVAD